MNGLQHQTHSAWIERGSNKRRTHTHLLCFPEHIPRNLIHETARPYSGIRTPPKIRYWPRLAPSHEGHRGRTKTLRWPRMHEQRSCSKKPIQVVANLAAILTPFKRGPLRDIPSFLGLYWRGVNMTMSLAGPLLCDSELPEPKNHRKRLFGAKLGRVAGVWHVQEPARMRGSA